MRSFWRVAIVLALVAASGPVVGHSFWPTHYSAKAGLSLAGDRLAAVVVVEVPTFEMVRLFREYHKDLDLLAEIEAGRFEPLEDQYRAAQLENFGSELTLTVNGDPAQGRWQAVDSPANGLGTEGFFVYMLEFAFEDPAAVSADTVELEVRLETRVLPQQAVMLANVVEAGDGWEVSKSSIPEPEVTEDIPEGARVPDDLGLWTTDAVKRDLRVTFSRTARKSR